MSSVRTELHAGTSLKPFGNPPRMHDPDVQAAAPSSCASGRNVLLRLTAWTLVIGGRPEPVMGGHPQCLTKAWTREDNSPMSYWRNTLNKHSGPTREGFLNEVEHSKIQGDAGTRPSHGSVTKFALESRDPKPLHLSALCTFQALSL